MTNLSTNLPTDQSTDRPTDRPTSDIYYRDNIGNVSTSVTRHSLHGVELSLLSRFPMYGGWKNAWYQGYNLPTEVRAHWSRSTS